LAVGFVDRSPSHFFPPSDQNFGVLELRSGRKPLAPGVKRHRATFRRDRDLPANFAPEPRRDLPRQPDWLTPAGLDVWDRSGWRGELVLCRR
jgi:hypothetical protein